MRPSVIPNLVRSDRFESMKFVLLAVLIASLPAIPACAPNRASRHKPGDPLWPDELWLPTGAETDVGARCYDSGSCDLPFTSPSMDPEAISDHLTRRFQDAGWEKRCPTPEYLSVHHQWGWQEFLGGGLNLSDDAVIPGTSRYWALCVARRRGNVVNYHLKTVRMKDGRRPLLGYATYAPAGAK